MNTTNKAPKLSIIVPVYNIEKYLEKCLDSILRQEFTDFEVIAIDDGSTDGSGKILDEYSKKDGRIITIHIKNGGVSNARNIGLDVAKGEYIGFVDGDDYIAPDMYKNLIKEAENDKTLDIVQCEFVCVYENNSRKNSTKRKKSLIIVEKQIMHEWFKKDVIYCYLWTKIFKHELVENIRFNTKLKFSEDELFIFECLKQAKKIKITERIGYFYLQRQGSAAHNGFNEERFGLLEVNDIYVSTFSKQERFYYLIQCSDATACVGILLGIIKENLHVGRFKELRKRLLKNKWQVFLRKQCHWKTKVVTLLLWICPELFQTLYKVNK